MQRDTRDAAALDPWVGKIPWRRKWQPTPVFLPGESYGQRGLVGYSPWGRKESDTTKVTACMHVFYHIFFFFKARLILGSSEQCGCIMHGWPSVTYF